MVVSASARSPEKVDAQYLEWHALDHHPEQYGIDAIRLGQRWVSTPACRAARAAEHERFDAVDHVMQYHFTDPDQEALAEFFALGGQLRRAGRMPLSLPPVELGGYQLLDRYASPRVQIRAEVVPWRPARGVYLIIEHGDPSLELPSLCEMPGVAGTWRYRGGDFYERFADTSGLMLTVCYLDGDVVGTANVIGAALADAWQTTSTVPLLAAPLQAVVPWDWDRALPH